MIFNDWVSSSSSASSPVASRRLSSCGRDGEYADAPYVTPLSSVTVHGGFSDTGASAPHSNGSGPSSSSRDLARQLQPSHDRTQPVSGMSDGFQDPRWTGSVDDYVLDGTLNLPEHWDGTFDPMTTLLSDGQDEEDVISAAMNLKMLSHWPGSGQ